MPGLATYAYLNARLRAKISKLISAEEYRRLSRTDSIEECYEALRHAEYRHVFANLSSAADLPVAEASLMEDLLSSHREVAEDSKAEVREFVEELMRKYEVENLKVILRAWHSTEQKAFIYRGYICNEIPVDSILAAETIEEIIVLLGEMSYRRPLADARESYKKSRSLFYLEVALDKELYEATWRAIGELSGVDRKIASKLMGIEIDILNINWILRFKRYYNLGLAEITALMIPGGLQIKEEFVRNAYPGRDETSLMSALLTGVYGSVLPTLRTEKEVQALSLLEGFLKEIYAQQLRKALGGYPFTIGTVIAYLRLKRMEVANIVTVLNGKALDLPPEEIVRNLVQM